jgi:cell division protein FtsW (lipid II flippase)
VSRDAEAALLVGSTIIASMGVALVNLAQGGTIDAQVALTFFVFAAAFGSLHLAVRRWASSASPFLLPLGSVLTAIGFVEVYRIDHSYAVLQRWWLLIAAAFAVLLLGMLRNTGVAPLRRYRYTFLAAAVGLLLLPMLPTSWDFPLRGVLVGGSRLWTTLTVGPVRLNFQPGEIAKLALVIFLASYLAERQPALTVSRRVGRFMVPGPRHLIPVIIAWLASFGVLVFQRDIGASLLLFAVFVAMLYAATERTAYLVAGSSMFFAGAVAATLVFPHVARRVSAWLHPFADPTNTGYQILQSLFALGSGSLSGAGLGVGTPERIPAAWTDFIFSAVGEELGLAGSIAVIAMYALLVAVGFGIALRSRDLFRKLLAFGLSFTLGLQAFLIIAGVTRLLPLTGITLPFMSYGGSSLLANFLILALLARVSHEERT